MTLFGFYILFAGIFFTVSYKNIHVIIELEPKLASMHPAGLMVALILTAVTWPIWIIAALIKK